MADKIPLHLNIYAQRDDSEMELGCSTIKTEPTDSDEEEKKYDEDCCEKQTDHKEVWVKQEIQSDVDNSLQVKTELEVDTMMHPLKLEPTSCSEDHKEVWVKQEIESDVDNSLLVELEVDTIMHPSKLEPTSCTEDDKEVWLKQEIETDVDNSLLDKTELEVDTIMHPLKLEPTSCTEDTATPSTTLMVNGQTCDTDLVCKFVKKELGRLHTSIVKDSCVTGPQKYSSY